MSLYNDIMKSDYWISRIIQGIVGLIQMVSVTAIILGGAVIVLMAFLSLLRQCGVLVIFTD